MGLLSSSSPSCSTELTPSMMKRKGTYSGSGDLRFDLAAKRKKTPWRTPNDKKGNMDTSDAETMLQSILGCTKMDDFFKNIWEKRPLHVSRSDENFYGELFTLPVVKKVVETNEFNFLLDVNVSTYTDGQRQEIVEENGKVTLESMERLMSEKCASFNFCHPQRYIDQLWNILEKLETYFGCLWSANAFITPAGKQECAPHCDDAENFILQIEGTEEWKLYKPMVELSRDFTQDVLEENLGEPIIVVTLRPGDLLYFPRGVTYQSKADEASHSTYVALSTYQQNSWGDFMGHAVQQAIENALEDDVTIRRGLPVNFRSYLGTANNMDKYISEIDDEKTEKSDSSKETSNLNEPTVVKFKEDMQKCLAKLVDHIDVNKAADTMCTEFMASRLPPYGHCRCDGDHSADHVAVETQGQETEGKDDAAPALDGNKEEAAEATTLTTENLSKPVVSLTDRVKIKYPDHIRVVYVSDDDDDLDDESMVGEYDEDSQDSQTEEEGVEDGTTNKTKKTKSTSSTGEDDEDDEDADADALEGEPHIKVLHSLVNDRFSHMGFSIFTKIGCLKFDVSYAKALVALVKSKDYILISDLLMGSDEEKISLASRLAGE